eukprot:Ihof_evm1s666 gene=Ihof_evmTU1s666
MDTAMSDEEYLTPPEDLMDLDLGVMKLSDQDSPSTSSSNVFIGSDVYALRTNENILYESAMISFIDDTDGLDLIFADDSELEGIALSNIFLPVASTDPTSVVYECQKIREEARSLAQRGNYLNACRLFSVILLYLAPHLKEVDTMPRQGWMVGCEVERHRRDKGRYVKATVVYENKNHTYDIMFSDDEEEGELPGDQLRPVHEPNSVIGLMKSEMRDSCLNAARCALKLDRWIEVESLLQQIIATDPDHLIARYLLAKAQCGLKKFDEALVTLKVLKRLAPENKDVSMLISQTKQWKKQQDSKDQRLLKEMLLWMSESGAVDAIGRSIDATKRPLEFKNRGLTIEELRARRVEHNVQLRKTKRSNQLMKRRNVEDVNEKWELLPCSPLQVVKEHYISQLPDSSVDVDFLDNLNELESSDTSQMPQSVPAIREFLDTQGDVPIDDIAAHYRVVQLVDILGDSSYPTLQLEAARALTRVTSGTREETRAVIDTGAIPLLIQLLWADNEALTVQCLCALGNIAGECPEFRDIIYKAQIMPALLHLLNHPAITLATQRHALWVLANLCCGKAPRPDPAILHLSLPTLSRLLYSQDVEILTDCCWALAYVTEGDSGTTQKVIEAGVVRRLVELLRHRQHGVQMAALRVVRYMLGSHTTHIQVVLNCGVMMFLGPLLRHSTSSVRLEACHAVSNVMAGSRRQ